MAHRHTFGVQFTGPDVEADGGHYHLLPDGEESSTDPEGPRHTHTGPGGRKTSGPVPLSDGDRHGARRKKKKKKKKKKY